MRQKEASPIRIAAVVALALFLGLATQGASQADVTKAQYLNVAENGIQRVSQIWWNANAQWYTTRPPDDPKTAQGGLATLWDVYPLFETVALTAIADPSSANIAAVTKVGIGAEDYWDPTVGGYAYYPGDHRVVNIFFDDNGWFGLAFFDAYKATGDKRFLNDAWKAWHAIYALGWAQDGVGGIWWDTAHEKKTAEPLAAEALLSAELYQATHKQAYLLAAEKMISWGDAHSWNDDRGLYQRSDTSDTVMDYVQGMMIGADAILCQTLHQTSWCTKAEGIAHAAEVAFPPSYHWAPECDAIYYRFLASLTAADHDPQWYRLAAQQGTLAMANARDDTGLFTETWTGDPIPRDRLLTPSGTLMLFASLAVLSPS
jgi:uncharacterized protein YyaL (SSP411 family)